MIQTHSYRRKFIIVSFCFYLIYSGNVHGQISFSASTLQNATVSNPTSLQFGPDGKLYVSQQDGTIKIFTIIKEGANNYKVTNTETVLLIKRIPNHFDDGSSKPFNIHTNKRQVTGFCVTGTADNPVLYVSSSDSDIGAGSNGDKNLCTNSGIISKLEKNGDDWVKTDLVRGLPRSEENHATNGIVYDPEKNYLYVCSAGMTNAGSPSKLFAYITEYALSTAVLAVDLNYIEALPLKTDPTGLHPYKYDIPTLDDPTRPNTPDGKDINDPWGGNDGLNQAKLLEDGPIKILATGFRNPYDILLTKTPGKERNLYLIDNGANPNWGGHPDQEGTPNVTNNYVPGEPGSSGPGPNDPMVNNLDGLHLIGNLDEYIYNSYYGGHPNPIRANPAGAGLFTHEGTLSDGVGVFRSSISDPDFPLPSDWPPVPLSLANPIEGNFQNPGEQNAVLLTYENSTNGLCEYTASNFGGLLKGDILTVGMEGQLHRIKLSNDGKNVLNAKGNKKVNLDPSLASGFGSKPLDVTAQGDNEIFPGTIWVAVYASNTIVVFEPNDALICQGENNTSDEDGDGYSNADEIDNETNPCSAASKPDDFDQDFISDLNDTDDDGDGIADIQDFFQIDSLNGKSTSIPLTLSLFNNDPGTGFFGVGFTGIMNNGTDYKNLYDESNLIAGGAIGALTITNVSSGDALGNLNNQEYGFQIGVNVTSSTPPFYIHGEMLGNFFNNQTPTDFQSQGIFFGKGDQNNYLKIALNANGGQGGIEVVYEKDGIPQKWQYPISALPYNSADLYLHVVPSKAAVLPKYSLDGGQIINIGDTIFLSGTLKNTLLGTDAIALGIISTSRGSTPFNATWDLLEIKYDENLSGNWQPIASTDGILPAHRHENAYVQCGDRFYLLGGRGSKPTGIYNPLTKQWSKGASPPIWLHHFQAVELNGLIYVAGAFTGNYPSETPVPVIYIYDPKLDKWFEGDSIPADRRRGSSGAFVRNNKIYMIGGITNGHNSGHVNWFDEYDPAIGVWKTLANAPHSRDHFQAALKEDKLFLAGGRQTAAATGHLFDHTVEEVDVFDFGTQTWTTLSQNIPTPRAGASVAIVMDKLLVIGGESPQLIAHNETEGLDLFSYEWKTYDTLTKGRHATQAIVNNEVVYIAGGSGVRGSGEELNTQEIFSFGEPADPILEPVVKSDLIVPEKINFGTITNGTTAVEKILIENKNGNQAILITSVNFDGASNAFSLSIEEDLPIILPPGSAKEITLTYTPESDSLISANLIITSNASKQTTVIKLTGGKPEGLIVIRKPVYLINTGGPETVQDTLVWLNDSQETPSTFSNYQNTFNKANTITYYGNNTTDAPDDIFNYYRWDPGLQGDPLSNEMQWSFPVENGDYELNLYFAETYPPAASIGERVFDILAEGTLLLNDFDIFKEAGFNNAIKKSFTVKVNDEKLNLVFLHQVQNPLVYGISIFSIDTIHTIPDDHELTVNIVKPTEGSHFNSPATILLEAEVNAGDEAETYLKIDCPDNGWRKLKLGYNSSNLWNPKYNVIDGGNNTIEIILKDLNGTINWNKLSVRPQGNSQSPVILGNYISGAQLLGDGWMLIKIPLSDFNSAIDFTKLSLIEIPYSSGAGIFSVGIKKISFTGGSSPFLWFGDGKTDNYHDGVGGGGQLLAELQEATGPGPAMIEKVEFYANGNLILTDPESPYQFSWSPVPTGIYELQAIAYTDKPSRVESEKIIVEVDSVPASVSDLRLIIHFDSIPSAYSIHKAPLKYNKDFAYSLTLDDGKVDAYTNVYTLFSGGTISANGQTYPGLFYTDGCGNDIPFRAGLAWNSANSSGKDVHNNTPGYLTWDHLKFLYGQQWDVFNHSYSHKSGAGTDYAFQISENKKIVQEKAGIQLTHFVVPSGDENYISYAHLSGVKAVYDQGGRLPGLNGLNVSNQLSYESFGVNRHFINDGKYDTSNISNAVDLVAAKSINGNRYWYNEFTHKVDFAPSGGSLIFPTFEHHMKHLERTYGKSGKDNIWMAPLQEVYEYLFIRDHINYTLISDSNKIIIDFNLEMIPDDLSKNALSLLVDCPVEFHHVDVMGVSHYSFKGEGNEKIINFEWNPFDMEVSLSSENYYRKIKEDVIYRVSAGEETEKSGWESDKLYLQGRSQVIQASKLPEKNPEIYHITDSIFQKARTTENGDRNTLLKWEFPIEKGGEVEVRLYFTELLIDSLDKEGFNIQLEDSLYESQENKNQKVKTDKAKVKKMKAVSDGSLNLNIIKLRRNPLINGIEIICLNDRCNRNNIQFHSVLKEGNIIAFPNPAEDVLSLQTKGETAKEVIIRIIDEQGRVLESKKINIEEENINVSTYPTGVYYLEISSSNGEWKETIRIQKK